MNPDNDSSGKLHFLASRRGKGMLNDKVKIDLHTLLKHAQGDHGGAKRCAMFLLSLWNGDDFKADLQDLLYTDAEIFSAMLHTLQYLYGSNSQLDSFVTEDEIKPIIAMWGSAFKRDCG